MLRLFYLRHRLPQVYLAKLLGILVLNALQLRTLFGHFNFFFFWLERNWWVFCRRNARLAYIQNLVLVSMMSLFICSLYTEENKTETSSVSCIFTFKLTCPEGPSELFSLLCVRRPSSSLTFTKSSLKLLGQIEPNLATIIIWVSSLKMCPVTQPTKMAAMAKNKT